MSRAIPPREDLPVIAIGRLDLAFAPRPWSFADARRADIDRYFHTLQARQPSLYNGRVLLMHEHAISAGTLKGAYLETDYASFIAWRDWGFPDAGVKNCFALGALRGSDGGFLLGIMGAHTMNAGRIYFPGGTPEPADIIGGRVDLEAGVRREVEEETGLAAPHLAVAEDWTAVLAGPRIALVKLMQANEPADALRGRILKHLAAEAMPELADMHSVWGPGDLRAMMPDFVPAYLQHVWAREHDAGSARAVTGEGAA